MGDSAGSGCRAILQSIVKQMAMVNCQRVCQLGCLKEQAWGGVVGIASWRSHMGAVGGLASCFLNVQPLEQGFEGESIVKMLLY